MEVSKCSLSTYGDDIHEWKFDCSDDPTKTRWAMLSNMRHVHSTYCTRLRYSTVNEPMPDAHVEHELLQVDERLGLR
jgi:hypothetical protein